MNKQRSFACIITRLFSITMMTQDVGPASVVYAVSYVETRPPVLWTGKTKCGRVFICLDGWRTVKKN